MTTDDFLRWVQTQETGRYELVDGQVVLLPPQTVQHVHVKGEAWLALRDAINRAELTCQAFASGVGVRINEHTVREPDMSIQYQPADQDSLVLEAPIVVAEVVSRNSGRGDTGSKLGEYFSVATIQHYLIIDPVHRLVVRHSRRRGSETLETEIHRLGAIELTPPGMTVEASNLLGPALNPKSPQE